MSAAHAHAHAHAQSQSNHPTLIAPPIVDAIDQNDVSLLSGEEHFSIPTLNVQSLRWLPAVLDVLLQ